MLPAEYATELMEEERAEHTPPLAEDATATLAQGNVFSWKTRAAETPLSPDDVSVRT